MREYKTDINGICDQFVIDRMREYDPITYTEEDFKIFKSSKHQTVLYFDENFNIVTFCVIMVLPDQYKMAYTWCKGTRESIRAYTKGIDYVVARYNPLVFGKGALKFNKIKRITKWIDKP